MNGIVATGFYNDALDRPTRVISAYGTAEQRQTSFAYDDPARTITTTGDLNGYADNLLKSQMFYDGLGRTVETRTYEAGGLYVAMKQTFDAMGRASQASNPHRPGLGESPVWTTTAYDGLSRVVSVMTPDGAVSASAYSGNQTTATDQALRSRRSVADALGRLTTVFEDPNGLNYQTSYTYDVLDNLRIVTQDGQTRTFVYDSLSRLTSAANPENGTVSYQYDPGSNLTQRTDARGVTTTSAYDVLNRVTSRTYNDGTPSVAYFYDSQPLPGGAPAIDRGYSTGRLVAVTYGGSSAGTYSGFSQAGKTIRQVQQTDSVNYLIEATYNKAGALKTEIYPAVPGHGDRRVVSYDYDVAGRPSSMTTAATGYAAGASATINGYAPHGSIASETYGNGLVHAFNYNSRLQTTEIRLGTAGSPASVLGLTYDYGTTNNNGNVNGVTYGGGGLNYAQSFGYDALNRLATAQETAGGSPSWSQTNGYDRYGNRWVVLAGGAQSQSFDGNNRIAGASYDAAGNPLSDGAHGYGYDAESRVSSVNGAAAYRYDGGGQRVRKFLGENLRFVYDMTGQLIAEYDGATGALRKEYVHGASGVVATIEPAVGTKYTTSDLLGSPRVVTNAGGGVVSRHDYMPFGEELTAGTGGRTAAMGYGAADGLRQKFTGKERDGETGLDYFEARYYSNGQGRFTSADPLLASASASDPQSWNRYAYVLNNPARLVDPDGLDDSDANRQSEQRRQQMSGQQPPQPRPQTPQPANQSTIYKQLEEIKKKGKPLAPGQTPAPTTIVYIQGDTKQYNGEPAKAPDGTGSSTPVYGMLQINAVAVLDQGGNVMGPESGVMVAETISPDSPDAQRASDAGQLTSTNGTVSASGEVNTRLVRERVNKDGLVFDRVGVAYTNPADRDATFSKPFDVQVRQQVYASVAGEKGSRLMMTNKHQVTNSGIKSTIGGTRAFPRQ